MYQEKVWTSLYFPISYYNSLINGADYMSQDGSPFHDPGTLIKSNKTSLVITWQPIEPILGA